MVTLKLKRERRKKFGRAGRARRRRAKETTKRPVPDTSQKMIDFMRFLKARGFLNSNSLQPVFYDGQGRGLRCSKRRSLPAKSKIVSLPLSCILLPSAIVKSNPTLYGRAKSDEEVLAHFLYKQRQAVDLNQPAEWASYIRILPQSYDSMPASQLMADLSSDHLPDVFAQLLTEHDLNFTFLLDSVRSLLERNSIDEDINIELFKWVYDVLNTRCISTRSQDDAHEEEENQKEIKKGELAEDGVKDKVALAPFFDFINHCPFSSASARVCFSKGTFELTSYLPVKRGSQIFINYNADETNRNFFLNYGFTHIPQVPKRLLHLNSPEFALIPSPQDFFKITTNELFRLPKTLPMINLKSCYKTAAARMAKRKKVLVAMNKFPFTGEETVQLRWPCVLDMRHEEYVVCLKDQR